MTYAVTFLPIHGSDVVGMFWLGLIATLIGFVALYVAARHEGVRDEQPLRIGLACVCLLLLFGGYAYGSQYMVDGHCTPGNWATLEATHGYWEAIVVWYVIAGC